MPSRGCQGVVTERVENMTTGCFTSRRNFLRTTVAGGTAAAAALASALRPGAPMLRFGCSGRSPAASRWPPAMIAPTLRSSRCEPFKKEIAAAIGKKRVIIKPNNVISTSLCRLPRRQPGRHLEFLIHRQKGHRNCRVAGRRVRRWMVSRTWLQQICRTIRRKAGRPRQGDFRWCSASTRRTFSPIPAAWRRRCSTRTTSSSPRPS